MAVIPEHFLTEELGDRYQFDTAGWAVVSSWRFVKSADYNTVWLYYQLQSVDGNMASSYFKITDSVNTAVTAPYQTNNVAWQDSGKRIADISALNNVVCTLTLYGTAKGRVRGIVGLIT